MFTICSVHRLRPPLLKGVEKNEIKFPLSEKNISLLQGADTLQRKSPLTLKSGDEFRITFENVMIIFFAKRDIWNLARGTEQDTPRDSITRF